MDLKKIAVPVRMLNKLKKKSIHTVEDFLEFEPKKYHKFGEPKTIDYCQPNEYCPVLVKQKYVKKNFSQTTKRSYLLFRFFVDNNENGRAINAFHFEENFNLEKYKQYNGKDLVVCGRIKLMDDGSKVIDDICSINELSEYKPYVHIVYPNVKGVSDEKMAVLREDLLDMQAEIVEPRALRASNLNLLSYPQALKSLHFPKEGREVLLARQRLIFNDLLYFNLSLKSSMVELPKETTKHFSSWNKTQNFISTLPFPLTKGEGSQQSLLNEIFTDIKKGNRIDMLVQGDVGCGKTVVAVALMMYAAENGYQSVLMAPRDVLAKQHFEEIKEYADKMGFNCVFLGGTLKVSEKKKVLSAIKSGEVDFIVGTHACVAKDVEYHNLATVIVDEEHIFGVEQKEALVQKAKDGAHSLYMSATPIPRTMATVMYGDQKKIRIISKKPAGRLPIDTIGVKNRDKAFARMEKEIASGHQCYVVCPAIEEKDNVDLVSLEEAEKAYRAYFEPKGIRVGIVNGKLKKEEVEKSIDDFTSNTTQILLSTTVIEVGVNVPNSTVMVIEQADRFGLATLHQLRGRVGRNSLQSYCILVCEDENNQRIKVMCETNDGFKIAEADLQQRGTGDLIGTAQSGENKYIDKMLNNPILFQEAEKVADYCLENNLGHFLMNRYEEHLLLESETPKKKRSTINRKRKKEK